MRKWLSDCDQHHKCQTQPYGDLPTRVLDRGYGEDRRHIHLKCDTQGLKDKYVALSHG